MIQALRLHRFALSHRAQRMRSLLGLPVELVDVAMPRSTSHGAV